MIVYFNPVFYVFLAAFTAFILLLLTTVSVPLVSSFYFLYASQANGVRFGLWGWCLDSNGTCSYPLKLGYTWEPEIITPVSGALVFYPISVILVFITMIFMSPELCKRHTSNEKISSVLAWSSVVSSALAFLFLIGIYSVAKYRFQKNGFTVSVGNMPAMSLVATFLLLLVAVSPYFLTQLPEALSRSRSKRRHHRNRDELDHDLESQPSKRRGTSRRER